MPDNQTFTGAGYVTRARITPVMNLLLAAVDVQELFLSLSKGCEKYSGLTEPALRAVAVMPDWQDQIMEFKELS
jgi:hypothetical protein